MRRITDLGNVFRSSSGFTLIEVMVALGILSLIVAIFGTAVFEVVSLQLTWQGDVTATHEMRRAGGWFAGDALNAQTTSLTADAAPASSVTLNWTSGGEPQAVTYSLSGTELLRDSGSQQLPVARDVVKGRLLAYRQAVDLYHYCQCQLG